MRVVGIVGAWVVAGCGGNEYGIGRQTRVDVFEQDRLDAVDVLLVVDNSLSMVEEQANLASAFHDLIDALQGGNTDWRVAVTTTETSYDAWRASLEGAMDEVVLSLGADELDRFAWDDRVDGRAEGASYRRCDEGWSTAPATRGAPDSCLAGRGGVDDGPRPPTIGELVVAEVAPQPDGCGWVELRNLGAATLSLEGVTLRDDDGDEALLSGRLPPGATSVWTSFDDCGEADHVDPGLHLASGHRWVDPSTPDAERVFAELVSVGDDSFGLEMGLENAWLALTRPAHPASDGAFLRANADLALLFVSDEDDFSPDAVATYANRFREIKGIPGQREPERVRFGVVGGIDRPDPLGISCTSDLGSAAWATRYLALAELTGGSTWSICRELVGIAGEVGLTFSEQRYEFQLSSVPALETLEVALFADRAATRALPDPIRDVDYTLFTTDHEDGRQRVWLRFATDALPPGSQVVVRYETLPDTATIDVEPAVLE